MNKEVIIFDIDGTLSNPSERRVYLSNQKKDWKKFFDNMKFDKPVESIVKLYKFLQTSDVKLILCTGRPIFYKDMTVEWLKINGIIYDDLYMRKEGDFRQDFLVKLDMYDTIVKKGYDIIVVFEDLNQCVKMWREKGLTCCQVSDWEGNIDKVGLLTLMVGPSGSGKSTWLKSSEARINYGIKPSHIISTDEIREDVFGSFKDQSHNKEVFDILHKLVKERLLLGLPTVVDATNIRNSDRKKLVNLVKTSVRYIIINRKLNEKYNDGGWRNNLGFDLILKHEQIFNNNLKSILNGDGYENVKVFDLRVKEK